MSDDLQTRVALLEQRVSSLEKNTVPKAEYLVVRLVTFGIVGSALLALLGKIVATAIGN
ncbi:MAG: hypothetical protein ACPG77_17720 [Nannocystaceae bacterium]